MKTDSRPCAARLLGLPEDARIVIPHVDDVGMCHGANVAFRELSQLGFIKSGSVMVPCPWFREIIDLCGADRDLDVGVHLTLTSEWAHYRWRPLSTSSIRSGLIDEDGYMWRTVPQLRAHVVPDAAETELRAQLDLAMRAGLDITHIDAHMGAAMMPELIDIYLRLGAEYRLPVLFPRNALQYLAAMNVGNVDLAIYEDRLNVLEATGMPAIDYFATTPGVTTAECSRAYGDLIGAAPTGLSFLAFHCNAPGDIETIVPQRAAWRIDEFNLFRGREFMSWLKLQNLTLIGFRALRDRLRGIQKVV